MVVREDAEKSDRSNLEFNLRPPVSSSNVPTLKNVGAKAYKVRFKAIGILGMISLRTNLSCSQSRKFKFLKFKNCVEMLQCAHSSGSRVSYDFRSCAYILPAHLSLAEIMNHSLPMQS